MFIDEEIERANVGDPDFKAREDKFDPTKNGNCFSTAIHETGHAIVSPELFEGEPFDHITTLPRGNANGCVASTERRLVIQADFESRICVLMGGRATEELIYGRCDISVGALEDIKQATRLVRRMVEMFGFSEELGFIAFVEQSGNYIGKRTEYTCFDAYREKCDNAVNELIKRLYAETLEILTDKKELILPLAEEVFNRETMSGEEFMRLYESHAEIS